MPAPRVSRADETIAFGPFVLDPAAGYVRKDAAIVRLRPKAWDTLRYLVERPGMLVSADELLEAVWEGCAVTPQTLTNVICELRIALDDRARTPRYVETVHGRGYIFVGATRPAVEAEPIEALRYLEQAAANAERHFAYRETSACLRAALSYLDQPGGPPAEQRQRAGELALWLGTTLTLAASYSAPEVGEAFTRARSFFASIESVPGVFAANLGLARWTLTRAEYVAAQAHAETLLGLGRSRLPEFLSEACCWAGFAASAMGDLRSARSLLEEGAAATTQQREMTRVIQSQLGLVRTAMGDVDAGHALTAAATAAARACGQPGEIVHAELVAAECAVFARDRAGGVEVAEAALRHALDVDLRSFVPLASIYVAWLDERRPPAERVATMRSALADRAALGDRWHASMLLALTAEVELAAGEPRAAQATLRAAMAHVEATGERHYLAEIHRLREACASALDTHAAADVDVSRSCP
jgi:DNA-binding winged helix-turn-helix (wHTH) protein